MRKILLFLVGFFLTLSPVCYAQDYSLERIFYLPKYNAVNGVESLEKNWENIDILAPQYHTVSFVGNSAKITGNFGPKLKQAIKDHNLKVMPLVANSNFSQSLMHKLLLFEKEQDRVIAGLVYLAKRDKYIGWQFDFENISYKDRDLFSAFVERTYKSFKKNKLILSVAAITRTVDYEDTNAFKNWGGVYDYKRIANSSDFISLMAYDDPNSVGPVASTDYVNGVLEYMKDKIPAEKLSLGVPLYYWKWENPSTSSGQVKKLGSGLYKNVLLIQDKYAFTTGFDEKLGVSWLDYVFNDKQYKIWFEDAKSFQAKMQIAKNNNLRGFSAWLLGGEDPAIWKIFSND